MVGLLLTPRLPGAGAAPVLPALPPAGVFLRELVLLDLVLVGLDLVEVLLVFDLEDEIVGLAGFGEFVLGLEELVLH